MFDLRDESLKELVDVARAVATKCKFHPPRISIKIKEVNVDFLLFVLKLVPGI